MNKSAGPLLIVFAILFWISAYSSGQAATYYVSRTGNNANPGTISQPFATIQKAHDIANPGDLIYLRGGTYTTPGGGTIFLSRSGSSGNLIKLWAYPGETPVIDAINTNTGGAAGFMVTGSWWHIKGLEVKNAYAVGIDIRSGGSNNIVELCNLHHNIRIQTSGSAVAVDYGSNNLILNNDTHHNGNYAAYNGGSGIGINGRGTGNVVRGNRVWRNNDNGIELWDGANVLVENNWVWETGYDDSNNRTAGDGIGLKLGGAGAGDGNSTIRNNLSWGNAVAGFDNNAADNPLFIYNNTAYNNTWNYITASGTANVAHQLKNNIAYVGNAVSPSASTVQVTNSWNSPPNITVNASTFLSLDFTANLGARKADGSLPDSNFLRLNPSASSGNNAVDKGTNVGLPFNGSAPDLGAYEYTNQVASLPAPSNLVVQP